ncbi:unnamed protein product [Toxocara canis]|uniref:non-specific serine/threonine protein kinase n=1 Tax=Toxocara canis TaxID=6265 RepID=A0A3P7FFF2_TOXCA|nr:unnamed protein product [Toxocara canis]
MVIMTTMAKSSHFRQIHSEPATISSIHTDLNNLQMKDTKFDLPNVINGSPTTKNVYNPPLREQLLREHLTHGKSMKMDSVDELSSFVRTVSAQSLPVTSSDGDAMMTPYQRTLHMLANDPSLQKLIPIKRSINLQEVALGKRIGFYRLGKELGAGNFSKVKLGVHVLTKEKVAVKIMEKSKMDQKAQRLLTREIQSMEILHHPNIIRLFECVETISRTFLVLEYAGGGELYAFVQERGKLTENDGKPLFAQIVSAVAHMHAKNIVHRDIKAENVIFSHPGWVKLADFGFSCQVESGANLSTFCGSPPYAAPELFKEKEYSGPMVDIWALGVLLYFMLVGMTPFRGETINDLTQNILKGTYNMPEYLSTFAQHIISRMLEMDANKRMTISDVKVFV